jgi:Sec-independent protein translocase protein TatA
LARSLGRGKREFHKGAFEDADALREQGRLSEDDEKSAHPEGDRAKQRASS